MPRRVRIGLVCLVLAGLIGVGAIVDHREKTVRSNRAELAEWFCTHRGTRCGGASSAAMERAWNRREVGYEASIGLLGVMGAASLVLAGRRRLSLRDG